MIYSSKQPAVTSATTCTSFHLIFPPLQVSRVPQHSCQHSAHLGSVSKVGNFTGNAGATEGFLLDENHCAFEGKIPCWTWTNLCNKLPLPFSTPFTNLHPLFFKFLSIFPPPPFSSCSFPPKLSLLISVSLPLCF